MRLLLFMLFVSSCSSISCFLESQPHRGSEVLIERRIPTRLRPVETPMLRRIAITAVLLAACTTAGPADHPTTTSQSPAPATRIFEIRTYTAPEGKLDALHARFRDHTVRIFERHGMTSIGYWTPTDSVLSKNTIIYILAYPSREAARESWAAFGRDPEWQKVRAESEANGRIVERVQSVFVTPTDYSPIR